MTGNFPVMRIDFYALQWLLQSFQNNTEILHKNFSYEMTQLPFYLIFIINKFRFHFFKLFLF